MRRFEFEIDGQPIPDASRNPRVTLGEGDHDILVRMVSDYGEVVESTETVTVVANKAPTCSLRLTETSTSWRYRSECRDEDGRVSDYEWKDNGKILGLACRSPRGSTRPSPTWFCAAWMIRGIIQTP